MTQTTPDGAATTPPPVPGGDAVASAASTIVEAIQAAFPSAAAQLVGTVLGLAALGLLAVAVRKVGPLLKGRSDDHDLLIETAQASVITTWVVVYLLFLIVVWRGTGLVVRAVPTDLVTGRTVARTVLSVLILLGAGLLTRLTKRGIRDVGRNRSALSDHHTEITHHVVQVAVYGVSLFVVFAVWGVNPANLLVGAGFAGIVLGLAARQTLGAVLAGFVVLFSRPFELGDWVVIGDQEGVVTDITIVNTQIRTFDDEYVMVPNDRVTDSNVVNRSREGRLRLNLDVGVDYGTDVEEAIAIATEAMADHDLVLARPEPHVVITGFGDSSIGLRLRFHIDTPSARKMWQARTRVTLAVKRAFDEAGIEIPFPQRALSERTDRDGVRVGDDGVTVESGGGTGDGAGTDGEATDGRAGGDGA
ncbi:mechanosensitive ion channel protein MscS [Halobacteriales archaeon QS_6_71_20]|nr:MAG: mechanosensitive ion channel protein MscS [Halobacteriales archaeon QS_6_71_20]